MPRADRLLTQQAYRKLQTQEMAPCAIQLTQTSDDVPVSCDNSRKLALATNQGKLKRMQTMRPREARPSIKHICGNLAVAKGTPSNIKRRFTSEIGALTSVLEPGWKSLTPGLERRPTALHLRAAAMARSDGIRVFKSGLARPVMTGIMTHLLRDPKSRETRIQRCCCFPSFSLCCFEKN